MTAFLSGEMRDTVDMVSLALPITSISSYPIESRWILGAGEGKHGAEPIRCPDGGWQFFSRRERAKLFRRWPGASSMWVKGGNRIWGDHESAPVRAIQSSRSSIPADWSRTTPPERLTRTAGSSPSAIRKPHLTNATLPRRRYLQTSP